MNKIYYSLLLGCALPASLLAQSVPPPVPQNTNSPVALVLATVFQRSANERVWVRIANVTNFDGSVALVTNKAYVELSTGIGRFSAESNAWVDADPTINIVANGASATRTRHTVTFAGNAAAAGGAVTLTTPDGKTFVSSVYGLDYYDSVTGSNVLLGTLQPAGGIVVGDHEVIFSNVFSGSVTVDLEYFNKLSGLEQNVVLKTALPTPDSFAGAGLNNHSALLEIWTEFLAAPEPQIKADTTPGVEDDLLLDFGEMKMIPGYAFATQKEQGAPAAAMGTHVGKLWVTINQRKFLIERIPYEAISNEVRNLPAHASLSLPGGSDVRNIAAVDSARSADATPGGAVALPQITPLLPLRPRAMVSSTNSGPMRMAQAGPVQPGYSIDYTLVAGATDYVFQGGMTYYASGTAYLYGTNTFEPGTVVKCASVYTQLLFQADPGGSLEFNGSAYAPTVFTDINDDSVGSTISGSPGSPSTGLAWFLWSDATTPATIAHARFSYANVAFSDGVAGALTFRHCQFVQCGNGIACYGSPNDVYLQNVLASQTTSYLVCGTQITVFGEQMTVDSCGVLAAGSSSYTGNITNSIFTAVATGTNFAVFTNSIWATSGAGIYTNVGNGGYYLATNSATQGAGTVSIDAATLADMQTMTTHPPVVYSNTTISLSSPLGIAAPRDLGITNLDMGYHYAPLDYVFGGTTNNASLTFLPGTAVGWFNPSNYITVGFGIIMANSTIATFQGTEEAPVWWVRANTVQEAGGNTPWPGAQAVGGLVGDAGAISDSPEAHLFFTKCSILAQGDYSGLNHFRDYSGVNPGFLILRATDSEFYGGGCGGYAISMLFTNCLMERTWGSQEGGYSGNQFIMRNVTWRGSSLTLTPSVTAIPISIRDCTFDGTVITASGYGITTNADYSYNAFTNSSWGFPVGGSNDVIVTSGFNWQTNWLGNYYLPSDSPLTNAGDASAASYGLYHFTTQTNQIPQGDATVDLGYHYIATDAYGNPLDTAGDGVPDYIADSNGDGVYEAGIDFANWLNPFTIFDQGFGYGGYYPPNVRLGYWKFDTTDYTNQAGFGPKTYAALSDTTDWSGKAVDTASSSAGLYYPMVTNGWTNLNCGNGTIRLWFMPHWSSGSGPSWSWVFGFESSDTNEWALQFDPGGSILRFYSCSNEWGYNGQTAFSVPMNLVANQWYQFALTYSPT